MADIRDCVRSLLPGRARLRHPMLHGLEAESCREVAGMLETIPGVTGVSINPRVGSLLITWNEAETTAETLLETVEGYAAIFFAAGAEDEAGAAAPADEKETSCTACRAVERAAEAAGSVLGRIESAGVGTFGAAARTLMPETSRRNPPASCRTARCSAPLRSRSARSASGRRGCISGRASPSWRFLPCTCSSTAASSKIRAFTTAATDCACRKTPSRPGS